MDDINWSCLLVEQLQEQNLKHEQAIKNSTKTITMTNTDNEETAFHASTNHSTSSGYFSCCYEVSTATLFSTWVGKVTVIPKEDLRGVGGHSIRKYASRIAHQSGATTEQVGYRGRWVGKKGRSICARSYVGTDDPYTDAFVATLLCQGGLVAY
jgi:hypothetical protein